MSQEAGPEGVCRCAAGQGARKLGSCGERGTGRLEFGLQQGCGGHRGGGRAFTLCLPNSTFISILWSP